MSFGNGESSSLASTPPPNRQYRTSLRRKGHAATAVPHGHHPGQPAGGVALLTAIHAAGITRSRPPHPRPISRLVGPILSLSLGNHEVASRTASCLPGPWSWCGSERFRSREPSAACRPSSTPGRTSQHLIELTAARHILLTSVAWKAAMSAWRTVARGQAQPVQRHSTKSKVSYAHQPWMHCGQVTGQSSHLSPHMKLCSHSASAVQ